MWYGLSDFNTSYVVVQPSGGKAMYAEDVYFNTSYVVVQRLYGGSMVGLSLISIHLMLWFNKKARRYYKCLFYISIHLMLWFNFLGGFLLCVGTNFNTSYVVVQHSFFSGAKRKLIHFNTSYVVVQLFLFITNPNTSRPNFNTSYVVVQRIPRMQTHTRNGISIHLMLWFNSYWCRGFRFCCWISIHLMLWFNL